MGSLVDFISDTKWQRTSKSWKQLMPKYNSSGMLDESFEDYHGRVSPIIDVPVQVAEQWLFQHYTNGNTIDNYGWLDYAKAEFTLVKLNVNELQALRIIKAYQDDANELSKLQGFDMLMCVGKDKEHWKSNGTWRVPPIVVNTDSFPFPPKYADFRRPLQLVEGHTRLGYLKALLSTNFDLCPEHLVYLLSYS